MRKVGLIGCLLLIVIAGVGNADEMRDLQDLKQLKKVFEETKTNIRIISLLSPT